jgi:hypothetical protein
MDLKTLINKTSDGIRYILAQPTMIFANKENITLLNPEHVVNADQAARPDLIALKYYGNQSKLDMILKWNSISDPFSINEGDVLEIPHANAPFYKLERPKEFDATNNPVKQQFVSGKRLSKKDQRRLDALKKKYGKDNLLPPNVIPVGKKNYEYVGSQIRMGAQAQTDAVVDAINRNLDTDAGDDVSVTDGAITIGGENTGSQFEKAAGGVWSWTGESWVAVNPDLAQEVAGSLYGEYGNPNGNITGSFEGQLYFDKLRVPADTVADNTSSDAAQTADIPGDNNDDGSNPTASGNNTNSGTSTNTNGNTPCG